MHQRRYIGSNWVGIGAATAALGKLLVLRFVGGIHYDFRLPYLAPSNDGSRHSWTTDNLLDSFPTMSSVGFTPQSKDHEVEKLREAWRSLNDLLKNLANAEACLKI